MLHALSLIPYRKKLKIDSGRIARHDKRESMAIVYEKQHIKTISQPSCKMSTCNGQDLTSKVSRKASKKEAKKTSVTLTQPKENCQNVVGKFFGKILGRSKSRKDNIKQTNSLEVSKA